jgi:hypothetical protein
MKEKENEKFESYSYTSVLKKIVQKRVDVGLSQIDIV